MRNGSEKACAGFEQDCGEKGIEHLIATYKSETAATLWERVEEVLSSNGNASQSVFDLLLETSSSESFSLGKRHGFSCILSMSLVIFIPMTLGFV